MAITDLTGTTWQLNNTLVCEDIGKLNLYGSAYNDTYTSHFDGLNSVLSITVGNAGGYLEFLDTQDLPSCPCFLYWDITKWRWTIASDGNFEGFYTDAPLLYIEGGTDATNPALIAWLSENGELQAVEPTITKKFTRLYIGNSVASSGGKCFKRLTTEEPVGYLTFSSPNSFTLATKNATKNWDGTLEYSTDTKTWNEWDGTTTLSADDGVLYMRGTSNTKITGGSDGGWVLGGSNIACKGNIENLLDYSIVAKGEHPMMTEYCYIHMFEGCTSLTSAPELPATILVKYCYAAMFYGCTSLTKAPELPATTLAEDCYQEMFRGCTSLTSAPELPATTLVNWCYNHMFQDCTSLTKAPELPVNTLAIACYGSMFSGCTSLTSAPELPATTLASWCYSRMFYDCTSLTKAPELPATTLTENCYQEMFSGCTSLTTAPALPATTLADSCYWAMFWRCTSLTVIPLLPAVTLYWMCYNSMFEDCISVKLSTTQTGEYTTPYRIPTSGTGTIATYALDDMFRDTGGTFTGTPSRNKTYYTSNTVI